MEFYTDYLAYDVRESSCELLASYEKPGARASWRRWFVPYGARRWDLDASQVQVNHISLGIDEKAALTKAGYDPRLVRSLALSYPYMGEVGLLPIPPDPKIPDYASEYDWKYINKMIGNLTQGAFADAVRAVRECGNVGERFPRIVKAITEVPDRPDGRSAWTEILKQVWDVVSRDRGSEGGKAAEAREVLRPIRAALPPGVPRPEREMVQGAGSSASDHLRWQMRLLAGLLYVIYGKKR